MYVSTNMHEISFFIFIPGQFDHHNCVLLKESRDYLSLALNFVDQNYLVYF